MSDTAESNLKITHFWNKKTNIAVLSVNGDLCGENAPPLLAKIESDLEYAKFRFIILNVAGISSLSMDAFSHLVKLQTCLRNQCQDLLICGLNKQIRTACGAAGVIRENETCRSLPDALQKCLFLGGGQKK